jgi:fused signal recognition particle receptor
MEELKKVSRTLAKKIPDAPHETLLVIDASMGQNAILQARTFNEAIPVTGIVLTKLDGTSKGGVVVGISNELKIPVRYIGIGEKMDDLREFSANDFVEALFAEAGPARKN